jgi:hypothetical protein
MNPESGVGSSKFRIPQLGLNDFHQFQTDGFQIIGSIVEDEECGVLAAELTPIFEQQQALLKSKIGGVRNLLSVSAGVQAFASSGRIISLLEKAVGSRPFAVRAIFFDKNPKANWLVPWHQDLAIAVVEHVEIPGFTGWSTKDGVLHVHPPQEVLEGMITLRLHLDDCTSENGALKVIPGSHRLGKLGTSELSECSKQNEGVICEVLKGGALLMRPLLLHASLPAKRPMHRRILHVEFTTKDLPDGLKWFES